MNMNFRKLFNVQTPEQKKIIVGEVAAIKNLADKEADKKNDNNRKYDSDANSKCPNCGSTTIVDKIQDVSGYGNVDGYFIFGCGSIYGSSSTKTNAVNNCTSCGNQWKKSNQKYCWSYEIETKYINAIHTHIQDKNKYTFPLDTINLLKEFHAESIYEIKKDACNLYIGADNTVTLKNLRKIFKSIYDEK